MPFYDSLTHADNYKDDKALSRKANFYWCLLIVCNIVVVPCIATAVMSEDCAYTLFVPKNNTNAAVPSTSANSSSNSTEIHQQSQYGAQEPSTPAVHFNYGYNCSSTILYTFASELIYQMILLTTILPFFQVIIKLLHQFRWFSKLDMFLPGLLKPFNADAISTLFHKHGFFAAATSCLAVLLSFGMVFPPLAAVACYSLLSGTFILQLFMSYLLHEADETKNYAHRNALDKDCANLVDSFQDSLTILIPILCCFYALFLFDILGRDGGWQAGLPVALIMLAVPVVLWLVNKFKGLCIPNYAKLHMEQQAKLLAVQLTYQKDVYRQFSPLAGRAPPNHQRPQSAANVTYAYRRWDSSTTLSPQKPLGMTSNSSLSSVGTKSKSKALQLIDLETYVN
eukprot:CAMPEP_0170120172 /NCGR_PEP_ID=MMETSP0020_2-20130122/14958_1 /TAXON_ID=98059 /ORGANISM="Dinobryon sp., Strain UTEXLB2267" /LENGTH=395 /DNA_ID=CAMNT_0010349933 /DNA_START=638 /DNA_END=1825 /DNA_ORIENTATION=-